MFGWIRSWQVVIGAATLVAMSVPLASRAPAQGIIELLFGHRPIVTPTPQADAVPVHRMGAKIVVTPQRQTSPRKRTVEKPKPPAPVNASYAQFCVRLCDGSYFPAQAAPGQSAVEFCRSLCPASRTQLYSGTGIDKAISPEGKRYTDLKVAFTYRQKLSAACTCNGRTPYGLAPVDIHSDVTLRPNDLVAFKDGIRAFTGFRKLGKSRQATFTPVNRAPGIGSGTRRELRGMKVASYR